MNELFKKLQSEAYGQCKKHEDGTMVLTDEWFIKYGQLIVKECAEEAKQATERAHDVAVTQFAMPDYVKGKIEKHFGLEE